MAERLTPTSKQLTAIRNLRRAIHREPELGHREWRTAELVEDFLTGIGLAPFRPAPSSVAVLIGPDSSKPLIGFRADLDALPILEQTSVDYGSTIHGVMHACGHDGHTAVLLGVAAALVDANLPHSVLLIFQQAEETYPSGAPLVLAGLGEDQLPPIFVAFHLWPQLPQGVVGIRPGPLFGTVAGVDLAITGRAGKSHGTEVEGGSVNALNAAIELHHRLIGILPWGRTPTQAKPSVLAIGQLVAGDAPNRIPTSATMKGTLRSLTWNDEAIASEAIRSVALAVEAEFSVQIHLTVTSGIRPPVYNAEAVCQAISTICTDLAIDCRPYPDGVVGVSDDFGWFTNRRSGALFLAGCGKPGREHDLHSPMFDFDEEALEAPFAILLELAARADDPSTPPGSISS